jgi:hypothetical protein
MHEAKGVGENDLTAGFFCPPSTFAAAAQLTESSFLNERTGNLYENKGPLRITGQRSSNVHEKKCT